MGRHRGRPLPKRMGNGMDRRFLPPRKSSLRLRDYDYSQPGYYFVTVCTKARYQNVLCAIRNVGGGLCTAPSRDDSRDVSEENGPAQRPAPTDSTGTLAVIPTEIGETVERSILRIPELNPGILVDSYVVMPDHVHFILNITAQTDGRPLPNVIGRFKSYTDHCYRLNPYREFGSGLWQENFYDHIIRSEQDLNEIRRYIQENPIKWGIQ